MALNFFNKNHLATPKTPDSRLISFKRISLFLLLFFFSFNTFSSGLEGLEGNLNLSLKNNEILIKGSKILDTIQNQNPLNPNNQVIHTLGKPGFIETRNEKYIPEIVEAPNGFIPEIQVSSILNSTDRKNRELNDLILENPDVVEVIIGDGELYSLQPINFNFHHSISQSLYFSEEIGMDDGAITALQYSYKFNAGQFNKHVKIYLGETDASDLNGGWVDPSTLNLVFDGFLNFPWGTKNILIELDYFYEYNGGNLVVYVFMTTETISNSQSFKNTFDPGSSRTRVAQSSELPIDPLNPNLVGETNNVFPNISLIFSTAGIGGLEGTVTSMDGEPLEGVLVRVLDTQINTHTNEAGNYELPSLLAGTYDVKLELFGCIDSIVEDVEIVAGETTNLDASLNFLPTITVSGFVGGSDYPAVGLEGAVVKLAGYENYESMTTSEGEFIFNEVYINNNYTISVFIEGYEPFEGTLAVEETNITLPNIILNELAINVFNVVATEVEGGALISWEEPLPAIDYRYDDGVVDGQLGFQGDINSIMGAIHLRNAQLHEMTWMLTNEGGPHNTVKVWVLGLTPEGKPDRNCILFTAENVPNVDDEWNTYTFPSPVNAPDGFFFGLSNPNKFLGLAMDDGVDEPWEHVPETQFGVYNITDPNYPFTPTEQWGFAINFLLRGFGLDFGPIKIQDEIMADSMSVRPAPIKGVQNLSQDAGESNYTFSDKKGASLSEKLIECFYIYRFPVEDQDNPDAWTIIASGVEGWEYLDEDWFDLPVGFYKFAVVAEYTNSNLAPPSFSNELSVGLSAKVIVNLSTNSGESPEGAVLVLTNQNGDPEYIYTLNAPSDGVVTFPKVWKGTYNLEVSLVGFETYTQVDIDANEDQNLSVILTEKLIAPYGLRVEEGENEGEQFFTWSHGVSWNESFEDGILPDGWTTINTNTSTTNGNLPTNWSIMGIVNYTSGRVTPQDGDYQAYLYWDYNHQDEWLITPAFTAPYGNLTFWYHGYNGSVNGDHYYVKISTDGGDSWLELWDASKLPAGNNFYESPVNIDLSAYAGQEIQIAWQSIDIGYGGLWYAWAIDNISVGDMKINEKELFVAIDGNVNEGVNLAARNGVSHPSLNTKDMMPGVNKSLIGYNVYLNDMETPLVTEIAATEFLFTNLVDGDYVAGVQSLYTSGGSEIATIPFTVSNGIIVESYNVTFNVHMHELADFDLNSDEIFIAGGFANWVAPGDDPELQMQPTDNPMILTLTRELLGGIYEYKYFRGNGWNGGEWNADDDREIIVTDDMIVENVFGNINDPVEVIAVNPDNLMVYPNPVRDVVHIVSREIIREVRIMNLLGQVVYTTTVQADHHEVNVGEFQNGIYFFQVMTPSGLTTSKIQILR
ncbi:MAG: T9SS type A sorting domain-containing protein [Bacteroidales bacterium]|jgi:hypothetical protein|nr:T9SS type A sorting domain-containing protein [Bacteroidales bacterium]